MSLLEADYNQEMQQSYIDYAMSVITGRALPDVKDGLKPVQRRILWAMYNQNIMPDKPYKKSARIVGEVLGKYHPHGDTAVYDSMVRMAQDFMLRYPLVDGHGNFGSMDGDKAAAMRYTEAKLDSLSLEMMRGIDKNTVKFAENFDGEEKEPTVLPGRFPNLLVNGASGIAVGMATSIPSHNLEEVVKAICYLIDNPRATTKNLLEIIKGPDFSTGAQVVKDEQLIEAYETGKGVVKLRGKAEIIKEGKKNQVVITEIPYTLAQNKTKLLEQIADLDVKRKLEGVTEVRDESNQEGIRIILELKKGANPDEVLARLFKDTKLTDSFSYNFTVLVDSKPKVLSLKESLEYYISFQKEVVKKEAAYNLKKAKERHEVLTGLVRAVSCLDTIIACIRASKNTTQAKKVLMGKEIKNLNVNKKIQADALKELSFTEKQAQAILDLRLNRLTQLESNKLQKELEKVEKEIARLEKLLSSSQQMLKAIKDDLSRISKEYSGERLTEIVSPNQIKTVSIKEKVDNSLGYVVVDDKDYIKWVSSRSVGENQDNLKSFVPVARSGEILITGKNGLCIRFSVNKLPENKWREKGKHISALVKLNDIAEVLALNEGLEKLVMITIEGMVKQSSMKDYYALSRTASGIKLKEGDGVKKILFSNDEEDNLIIYTQQGHVNAFSLSELSVTGRSTAGVKGIELSGEDKVAGALIAKNSDKINFITKNKKEEVLLEDILSKRAKKGKKMFASPIKKAVVQEKSFTPMTIDDYI